MNTPTCSVCGVEFDIGRRRTQESVDDAAAKVGWVLGLPHNRAFCPDHTGGSAMNPQMMFQLTLYSDRTLTIDGRADTDSIPFILRQIAEAVENGLELVDIPMN